MMFKFALAILEAAQSSAHILCQLSADGSCTYDQVTMVGMSHVMSTEWSVGKR